MSYAELEYVEAGLAHIPRLVFLLSPTAEGPAALFLDPLHGARQQDFLSRLTEDGATVAVVSSPGELEAALLHALMRPIRDAATEQAEGVRTHFEPRSRGVLPYGGLTGWYFTGRVRALSELVTWLGDPPGDDLRARLVTGAPGSGKSAVVSRLVVMSDPELRHRIPAAELDSAPAATLCRVDVIAARVHVRGCTVDEVGAAIATGIGVPAHDHDRLLGPGGVPVSGAGDRPPEWQARRHRRSGVARRCCGIRRRRHHHVVGRALWHPGGPGLDPRWD